MSIETSTSFRGKSGYTRRTQASDFRHRFATQRLLRWYRAGEQAERRLPVLSTYLGHVHVADTYWYSCDSKLLVESTNCQLTLPGATWQPVASA
jgi:integrase